MPTKPIDTLKGAFSVAGLNVVVTGGNRGIGLGIATAFAQGGANVAILCRNADSGNAAALELAKHGGTHFAQQCDTGDFDSVLAAVDAVYARFGKVDVLVNNAGVSTVSEFLKDEGLREWSRVVNTNLNGPAYTLYAVAPRMIEAGGGSVINISSIGGQSLGGARHHPMAPYHVSKAGLDMFTKNMALELGDYGIRVNGIAPGPTHSDLDKDLPKEAFAQIEQNMPMHRFAEPIEIGALCVFLSSPAGAQITGTVIVHDGGMVLGG
ncbi:MAG: SDR family oxidoreductase [Oscillospiraceae bacterium]|jgi:NAD(P)-dependent dehydrogenase (short-subunit alcohol dehydrogenase family)|nr:SDR family oxidoreductase [Oscillospiraceae bacterium]